MKDDYEIIDELKGQLGLAADVLITIANGAEIDLDETKINARAKDGTIVGSVSISTMIQKWKELSKR